jgi:hypothetical protein
MTTFVLITGVNGQQLSEGQRLSAEDYAWMVSCAKRIITRVWNLDPRHVTLLGVGGAWADHVAVGLFMHAHATTTPFGGLHVYLPCAFAWEERRALPAAAVAGCSPHFGVGGTLNAAHVTFAQRVPHASWDELVRAQQLGAAVDERSDGFYARNRRVAALAQRVLTFTWDAQAPTRGSARHLWDLCACPRVHQLLVRPVAGRKHARNGDDADGAADDGKRARV